MLSRAKRLSSASALTAIVAMQNISLESILFCVLILFTFRLVLFFREVFFFLVAIVTPAVWFSILEMQICVKKQIALRASSFPLFVIEIASLCVSPRFWAKRWNQRNFL